jgi:hydroxymethylglutaryl-CoA lyase
MSSETDGNARARRLFIQEVAPRDGFQAEAAFVPTDGKIALIDALSRAGLAKIEVTSFTSPKAIPMLADAEAVMRGIERVEGVSYTALVPNVRGAERAFAARVDELNLVMSASESHNQSNLKMSRERSLATLSETIRLAQQARVPINVSLSCSFGCPIEGNVDPDMVCDWAARFVDLGAAGVSLCDTTGMAYPSQVRAMTRQFLERWPGVALTVHFHNTRGMGLVNVLAAVEVGASRVDAALGGLGGCPYAPGATGNICTEDAVHMLELTGYETGVNLETLLTCARDLPGMIGHDIPGQLSKAGPRLQLRSAFRQT